jgi:hypothetical protein
MKIMKLEQAILPNPCLEEEEEEEEEEDYSPLLTVIKHTEIPFLALSS